MRRMGMLSQGGIGRQRLVGRLDRLQVVAVLSVAFVLCLQLIVYPMPLGNWIRGGVLGLLNAMLAMGMALIYRANRVVNFAQADLGSVPTAFAAAFILFWGWPYLLGLGAGLVLAVVLGAVVELAIIRRFRHSPRLVLTVATLGISQLMVVLGILVPRWWGRNLASERIAPPLDWKLTVGTFILNANDMIAVVVAPLAIAGVAWFLARSRLGLAVRASAERTERAAMLGIPVARINTAVWALSAVLAFLALFLKSGITGLPLGFAVGLPTLLQALAALVIGRLERLPTIVAMAFALGLLEQGVQWNSESPFVAYPIMAAVMFVVLMVQRPSATRRDNDSISASGLVDTNAFARTYDQAQWSHAFGVTQGAVRVDPETIGYYFIYQWFNGEEPPAPANIGLDQASPALFFAVAQAVGPTLTHETWKEALFSSPGTKSAISQPFLSWGESLWPEPDYLGLDDATAFWWDPAATGPDEIRKEGAGMYQFVDGGKRFLPGEWPADDKMFDPIGAVAIYETPPPGEEPPTYPSPAG